MPLAAIPMSLSQGCVFASGGGRGFHFGPIFGSGWDELYKMEGLARELIIKSETDLEQPYPLEIDEGLTSIERCVRKALRPILPARRRAQVVLGFAGRSKTDPLYALRYLDWARDELTGQFGYLHAYEQDDDALMQRYYKETLRLHVASNALDGDDTSHCLVPHWGPESGAIQFVQPQLGHLAMALLPGCPYPLVKHFLEMVLVNRGVAIWVHDYHADEPDWETQFNAMLEDVEKRFELLQAPIMPSPFKTPFHGSHPTNHVLLLRKKP
jgi:hypothetical protein